MSSSITISCHVFGTAAAFFSISSLIDPVFCWLFIVNILLIYLREQRSYFRVFLIYYVTPRPKGRLRRSLFFFLLYSRWFGELFSQLKAILLRISFCYAIVVFPSFKVAGVSGGGMRAVWVIRGWV